jgi:hypothetical protein
MPWDSPPRQAFSFNSTKVKKEERGEMKTEKEEI